jgi:hypothetical protein
VWHGWRATSPSGRKRKSRLRPAMGRPRECSHHLTRKPPRLTRPAASRSSITGLPYRHSAARPAFPIVASKRRRRLASRHFVETALLRVMASGRSMQPKKTTSQPRRRREEGSRGVVGPRKRSRAFVTSSPRHQRR